jgi:hypothetical protein
LNLSFIYNKRKDWANVILSTNKVLEYDEKHVKALYRRCYAYINQNNYLKADEDLERLEYLIGGTEELETLHKLFEDKQKQEKMKEKSTYKKMFSTYVQGILYYYS